MAFLKLTVLWTRRFWINTLEAALMAGGAAGLAIILNAGVANINTLELRQAGTAAVVGAGYSLLKSFHVTQTTKALKRGETVE